MTEAPSPSIPVSVKRARPLRLTDLIYQVRQVNRDERRSQPLRLDEGWSEVAHAMEGWLQGIMLVAGQTNHGKSSVLVNLASQVLSRNQDDIFVLDFTLDDTLRRRLSIYVALLARVQINDVLMEHRVKNPEILRAIDNAYTHISGWEDRLLLYDTAQISRYFQQPMATVSVESIVKIAEDHLHAMRQAGDQRRLLVILDAINDLTTKRAFQTDLQRQEYIVQQLVALATSYDALILCSSHSRKDTNWRNPNLDDVFGGSALKYAAQIITFVYNDVVGKASIDQSPMVFPEEVPSYYEGVPNIRKHAPILVWHWKKNKTSPFVGRFYLKLTQWCNRIEVLTGTLRDAYEKRFEDMV